MLIVSEHGVSSGQKNSSNGSNNYSNSELQLVIIPCLSLPYHSSFFPSCLTPSRCPYVCVFWHQQSHYLTTICPSQMLGGWQHKKGIWVMARKILAETSLLQCACRKGFDEINNGEIMGGEIRSPDVGHYLGSQFCIPTIWSNIPLKNKAFRYTNGKVRPLSPMLHPRVAGTPLSSEWCAGRLWTY